MLPFPPSITFDLVARAPRRIDSGKAQGKRPTHDSLRSTSGTLQRLLGRSVGQAEVAGDGGMRHLAAMHVEPGHQVRIV